MVIIQQKKKSIKKQGSSFEFYITYGYQNLCLAFIQIT